LASWLFAFVGKYDLGGIKIQQKRSKRRERRDEPIPKLRYRKK